MTANRENGPTSDAPDPEILTDDELTERVKELPKEVGVLLLTFGIAALILPGPIGTPAVLAGGLVLWPGAFGRVAGWVRKRNPAFYRAGMSQIERFVDDLERRYPSQGPTRSAGHSDRTIGPVEPDRAP